MPSDASVSADLFATLAAVVRVRCLSATRLTATALNPLLFGQFAVEVLIAVLDFCAETLAQPRVERLASSEHLSEALPLVVLNLLIAVRVYSGEH